MRYPVQVSTRADFGAADEALAAALDAWAADPAPERTSRVHAALLDARLLVPAVVAAPSGPDVAAAELPPTASAEMSLPTIVGRDGRAALPAFTSLDALSRWRVDARPVPVAAADVLRAVGTEGCSALLLDVAGPVSFVVEGQALEDLAAGYLPVQVAEVLEEHAVEGGLQVVAAAPVADPEARETIRAALAAEPLVAEAFLLAPAEGPGGSSLTVGLVLRDEVDPGELVAMVRRVADVLAPASFVSSGLDIAVLTAEQRRQASALGPPAYAGDTGGADPSR